jgi:hypothetical protein
MKNLDVRINNEGCSIVFEILDDSIQSVGNNISFAMMKLESHTWNAPFCVRESKN